jgi:hypothetical protein
MKKMKNPNSKNLQNLKQASYDVQLSKNVITYQERRTIFLNSATDVSTSSKFLASLSCQRHHIKHNGASLHTCTAPNLTVPTIEREGAELDSKGIFGSKSCVTYFFEGVFTGKGALSSSLLEISVLSLGAAEVGLKPTVSKSQVVYGQRVKDGISKQLLKNKEILTKVVADIQAEGFSKEVIRTMNFAPVVGLSWGGDDKSMLNLLSKIEKEKRELATP